MATLCASGSGGWPDRSSGGGPKGRRRCFSQRYISRPSTRLCRFWRLLRYSSTTSRAEVLTTLGGASAVSSSAVSPMFGPELV
jgi:hypothetical protein